MENYEPFISEGVVSLVGDESSSQKVKILRDTGATQSLMLDSVLILTEYSFTGANVLISGVEIGILEVPLHEVNIKSRARVHQRVVRVMSIIFAVVSEE